MAFGGTLEPLSGVGVCLQRGDGEIVQTFTTIAKVTAFQGPTIQAKYVDSTSIGSTNKFEEHLPGTISPGEMGFNIIFLPQDDTHKDLMQDLRLQPLRDFRLIFTDGDPTGEPNSSWEFSAYVRSFQIRTSVEDTVTATLSLKLSGEPLFLQA
jgi:hypothetical protein